VTSQGNLTPDSVAAPDEVGSTTGKHGITKEMDTPNTKQLAVNRHTYIRIQNELYTR